MHMQQIEMSKMYLNTRQHKSWDAASIFYPTRNGI